MTDPLEDKIRTHFERKTLPQEKVASILREARQLRRLSRWRTATAVFASVLVLASLGLALWWGVHRPAAGSELTAQMMASHKAHVPSEFDIPTEKFVALQQQMDKLDFDILPSEAALRERFDIQGARYCKVGSQVACALTVRERSNNKPGTVFIARNSEAIQQAQPTNATSQGLQLEYWHDNDRFFAWVGEINSDL